MTVRPQPSFSEGQTQTRAPRHEFVALVVGDEAGESRALGEPDLARQRFELRFARDRVR